MLYISINKPTNYLSCIPLRVSSITIFPFHDCYLGYNEISTRTIPLTHGWTFDSLRRFMRPSVVCLLFLADTLSRNVRVIYKGI